MAKKIYPLIGKTKNGDAVLFGELNVSQLQRDVKRIEEVLEELITKLTLEGK